MADKAAKHTPSKCPCFSMHILHSDAKLKNLPECFGVSVIHSPLTASDFQNVDFLTTFDADVDSPKRFKNSQCVVL